MAFDELDGLQPNTQKTGTQTNNLGTASNPWDTVYATSGNFTNAAITANGVKVAGVYTTVGTIPQNANGLQVTHNLNNTYPVVQVYTADGSGVLMGSGVAYGVRVDTSGANDVYLFAGNGNASLTGAHIVVVG